MITTEAFVASSILFGNRNHDNQTLIVHPLQCLHLCRYSPVGITNWKVNHLLWLLI